MHLSTPALTFAIIGFTSALPAAIISKPAQHSTNLTTSAVAPPSPVTASCTAVIPVTHTTSTTSSTSSTCTPTTSISTSCTTPLRTLVDAEAHALPALPSLPLLLPVVLRLHALSPKTNPPIRPCVTSQYDVWTGAVRRDEINGKIFKDGRKTDVTTLLTFNFPPETEGKTCSFHFDPAPTVSGSGQFDVFASLSPLLRIAPIAGLPATSEINTSVAWLHTLTEWLSGCLVSPTLSQPRYPYRLYYTASSKSALLSQPVKVLFYVLEVPVELLPQPFTAVYSLEHSKAER
ncbi:hypothetical protein Q7P37_004894 [Cladosporium fusiforme]